MSNSGNAKKNVLSKAQEQQPKKLHQQTTNRQSIRLKREQGEREFKLIEAKRELERKLVKREKELQRANALMKAADAERATAEKGLKIAQERLCSVEQQEDDDLSHLIRSLHSDLEDAKNRERSALAALERFKAARLIGSTIAKATQTGEGEAGGVIGGNKTVECQTDSTGNAWNAAEKNLEVYKRTRGRGRGLGR